MKDTSDENPLIRALAVRNMSNIPVGSILQSTCAPLRKALVDPDPYVCKTAAISVAKLFSYNPELVRSEGLLDLLKNLLHHENSNVLEILF